MRHFGHLMLFLASYQSLFYEREHVFKLTLFFLGH